MVRHYIWNYVISHVMIYLSVLLIVVGKPVCRIVSQMLASLYWRFSLLQYVNVGCFMCRLPPVEVIGSAIHRLCTFDCCDGLHSSLCELCFYKLRMEISVYLVGFGHML